MIKNIVFDIGMVLVDFRYKQYCLDLGMTKEDALKIAQTVINTPEWEMLDRGVISQEQARCAFVKKDPSLEKLLDIFWSDLTEIVHSYPHSKEWLAGLKSRGYKIYLLTNYPEEMFALHCKTQFDFLGSVDGMVVSSHVKLTKPDVRIYECLLGKYGLKADECVFLDDKAENTASAEALGFKTITVDDSLAAPQRLELLLESLEKQDNR